MIRANPEEPIILLDDFMAERRRSVLADRNAFIEELNRRYGIDSFGPETPQAIRNVFNAALISYDQRRNIEGADGYIGSREDAVVVSSRGWRQSAAMPDLIQDEPFEETIARLEREEQEFEDEDVKWFEYLSGFSYSKKKMKAHMNRLNNEVDYFNLWCLKIDRYNSEEPIPF